MSVHIFGVELGKNFCSVVGVDIEDEVVVPRSMRRSKLIDFFAQFPPCIVAMEACCGANHIGRLLTGQGGKR